MKKQNYISNRFLLIFFTVTFIWTWSLGFLPVILKITDTGLGTFLFYFGAGAPSVTALFLVFFTYPKAARKDYFTRCFSFKKMGILWPALTVLFYSVIAFLAVLISNFLHLEMPGMDYLKLIEAKPYMLFQILLISLVSGPINEEFGWRGYSLDRLLSRFGFAFSSLILGFIWAIWHLAWYFTPGQAQYNMLQTSIPNALMFLPSCILTGFAVSFVYIKTGRSILAGAFVHMMSNLLTSQLLSPYTAEFGLIVRYLNIAFCLILVVYTVCSPAFKKETARQIEEIKEDAKRFQA